MILIFPQATQSFNDLFRQMIDTSTAIKFLDKSLAGYDLTKVENIVIVLLQDQVVEKFIDNYLKNQNLVQKFEILTLKKETSGAICSTLMAISSLMGHKVIVSALDQILVGRKINFDDMLKSNHDVIVPTFFSHDNSLCYTLKDDNGKVIQLFEKKFVSNDAILGVYYLKDFTDFYKQCHELLIKYKGFKERVFYTSDVINNYIGEGYDCIFPNTDIGYHKIRCLKDLNEIL